MMGMIVSTASANRQSIRRSNMLAPMMMNTDETSETMACATNVFILSISEVRFVEELGGIFFFDVCIALAGYFSCNFLAEVACDLLGRVDLYDALQINKDEDRDRREEELQNDRAECEMISRICIDRGSGDFRDTRFSALLASVKRTR